jgi:hypothetical protein
MSTFWKEVRVDESRDNRVSKGRGNEGWKELGTIWPLDSWQFHSPLKPLCIPRAPMG